MYRAILSEWRGEGRDEVAVKTLKGKEFYVIFHMCSPIIIFTGLFSANDLNSLVEESLKMLNFNHLNVMKLIGVCIDIRDTPYIVMPFMSHGSLHSYLRKNREDLDVTEDNQGLETVIFYNKLLLSIFVSTL